MTNNTNKLWFKRRRYGWGWTPVSWQGWLSLILLLGVIALIPYAIFPSDNSSSSSAALILYFMFVISALFILIGVCFAKGPMPRWRWGKKPTDDPEKDF